MIGIPSQNTQAILLLTAPLIVGRASEGGDFLSAGDYNRLARFLREYQKQPGDLIGTAAAETISLCSALVPKARLEALLNRGFLLSQAVERWTARSIWVLGRADPGYPRRLKSRLKEDAPPLLYGCGDIRLLEQGGLAVVGSRHVDEELIQYTEKVGRLAAEGRIVIISGGAKGIDRAAMYGALQVGGICVGVLGDSLERAALARENQEPLRDRKLIFISQYDPAAGFNVGHAMQRNKIIYALSDAALVVNSDFEKGGTWAGAVEQLGTLRFVPVFVRNGPLVGKGNQALLERGGIRWPEPTVADELIEVVSTGRQMLPPEPKQEVFALSDAATSHAPPETNTPPKEAAPVLDTTPESAEEAFPLSTEAAADVLFATVRQILGRELAHGKTELEIIDLLGVNKPQAKAWLARLLEEGTVEKLKKSKPARYCVLQRLL